MTPEEVASYKVDRTGWAPGPWDGEPDRADWRHSGLPCLALRNQHGSWCGYVGLPPTHPLHGRDRDDIDVSVHGGLTYADECHPPICHVPAPGEPDNVWWFGFDCGHAFDLAPGMDALLRSLLARPEDFDMPTPFPATYRTLDYVRTEVNRLAKQLARKQRLKRRGRK